MFGVSVIYNRNTKHESKRKVNYITNFEFVAH